MGIYNNDDLLEMKLRRKRRTVLFGVVGGLAGLIVLGPFGAVLGGFAGALGTRANGKRKESRRRQEIIKENEGHDHGAHDPNVSSRVKERKEIPVYHATAM